MSKENRTKRSINLKIQAGKKANRKLQKFKIQTTFWRMVY